MADRLKIAQEIADEFAADHGLHDSERKCLADLITAKLKPLVEARNAYVLARANERDFDPESQHAERKTWETLAGKLAEIR